MYGRVVLGMGEAAGEGGDGGVEVVIAHGRTRGFRSF